ncbi:hypothetical protein C8A01DRAFT_42328 [Parachaetomium inaequale]|uniref:NADP-dependent oxidoreductase domain-containing protein n=1 Tax=Parachaetomium inaequale TaxID=2588326 RepID=A0AAN6SKN9_9PEZI|nr:hypothetical protein C8A01DRAFT_42328 [Parachaetomium inaequale]
MTLAVRGIVELFRAVKRAARCWRLDINGNGSKSLHTSVEASLRKLQTDHIDILYVLWWDFPPASPSCNRLIAAGKVLFLSVSDTPAWAVSRANES